MSDNPRGPRNAPSGSGRGSSSAASSRGRGGRGGAASSGAGRRRGFGGAITKEEGAASSSAGVPLPKNKGKGKDAPLASDNLRKDAAQAEAEEADEKAAEEGDAVAVAGVDAAEEEQPPEVELCFICAEPVLLYSVPPCDHRTCHMCAVRLRALYKKEKCTFCNVSIFLSVETRHALNKSTCCGDAHRPPSMPSSLLPHPASSSASSRQKTYHVGIQSFPSALPHAKRWRRRYFC